MNRRVSLPLVALLSILGACLAYVVTAEYLAPALRASTAAALAPALEAAGRVESADAAALVQQGAYLARIGNCAQCHTAAGGAPYAGGGALITPFGKVYGSNLTPHPQAGIGRWNAADFWRAMHEGVAPDGRVLNPAFPYTSFTHLQRHDSDALFAYLRSLPPANTPSRPHSLPWPLGSQTALSAWRMLHFRVADTDSAAKTQPAGPAHTAPQAAVSLARGAYLVQGLGHCAECHTPRNALGGLRSAAAWRGALMPDGQWYAPALNDPLEAGMSGWSVADIATLLTHGQHAEAYMAGPMAEVVRYSTQYLTPEDAQSMAMYLQTLAPPSPTASSKAASPVTTSGVTARPKDFALGERLYENHCAQCHGKSGEGVADAYPALAGNRAVLMRDTHNLVQVVLHGGYGPSTAGKPQPHGMPPYQLMLNDAEVAAVLSFIRNAWGQRAAPLSEFDINTMRNRPAP